MIHMIFYAPYPQIVPLIKQVFQERPDRNEIEYEIVQDFYNNPLQDLNADVVIARGFSALTMKQRGYICAELKVGGYDVIAAVLKARRRCPGLSHIAVIGSFNMIYGIESIRDAFPDMKLSTYRSIPNPCSLTPSGRRFPMDVMPWSATIQALSWLKKAVFRLS